MDTYRPSRRLVLGSLIATLVLPVRPADAKQPADNVLEITIQELADLELKALRFNNPDTWQQISYITSVKLKAGTSLLYCATHSAPILDRFAIRVERALNDGLHAFELAVAGPLGKEGDNVVTMFTVDTDSLERMKGRFVDLFAQYPEPMGW